MSDVQYGSHDKMLKQFKLENLPDLDGGRVAIAFGQLMELIVADCEDRPALQKPRKLQMVLDCVPDVQQDGAVVDGIRTTFRLKAVFPERESREYSFGIRKQKVGGERQTSLVFNDLSDDDIGQMTIDQVEQETEE